MNVTLRSQIHKAARFASLAMLLATVSAGVAKAGATTFFTDLPGFSQYESLGIGVYGALNVVFAEPFTAASTANLAGATLALGNYSGSNTPITLDLESDASGMPGSVLASLTQQGAIPQYGTPGPVTFNYNGAAVQLISGATYWLVAVETDPNSEQAWFLSNGAMGIDAFNYDGSATGPWTAGCPPGQGCSDSLAAFEVDGTTPTTPPITTVPEPCSLLLFGLALMIPAAVVRRRMAKGL